MAPEQLFEIARRRFDTPEFRGIEFIEAECKTIINPVPGNYLPFKYSVNPYRGCTHSCTYCFARPTHTFLDMSAGRDFETKIVVKVNAPEVLRRQLAAKRWKGDGIAMGTNTDPYQRAEGRYRLMTGIIRALTDYRNPFSILTKGTLILRDVDLLVEAARVTDVSTAFSIGTLDEDAWQRSEPGTPHPRKRIDAVRALNEAGIPCGVLMAPILPGITDDPRQLREVVAAAIDAGATHVSRSFSTCGPACARSSCRGSRTTTRTSWAATRSCTDGRTRRKASRRRSAGASRASCADSAACARPASPRPGSRGAETRRPDAAATHARLAGGIGYPCAPMRGMDRLLDLQAIDTAIDRLEQRRGQLEAGRSSPPRARRWRRPRRASARSASPPTPSRASPGGSSTRSSR